MKAFKVILTLFLLASLTFGCDDPEKTHRQKYWTDANYPKYGLLAMNIIPDSSRQKYLDTIKELVTVGRKNADFIPENSLKYAKEIADQMYLVQTEGLGIYLGQHQRIDKPLCHLDSAELAIFQHLKYGEWQEKQQQKDTVAVELINEP